MGTMVEAAAGAAVRKGSGAESGRDDDASDALMASTSARPRRSAGEAGAGRRGESPAPRRSAGAESRGETDTWWVVSAGSSLRWTGTGAGEGATGARDAAGGIVVWVAEAAAGAPPPPAERGDRPPEAASPRPPACGGTSRWETPRRSSRRS